MEATEKEKRTVTLRFRATPEEKKQLTAAARQVGKTPSEYLRAVAIGQPLTRVEPPRAEPLTGDQRRALVGIATNLNQAMRLSNAGQYATQELVEIITQIKSALK